MSAAIPKRTYPNANLNADDRRNLFIRCQHIPGITHRSQQRPLRVRLNLLPQFADVDIHNIRLRIEMIVPDVLQQHGAGYDLAGVAHQVLEELELLGLQRDLTGAPGGLARQQIDVKVADAEARLGTTALHTATEGV